MEPHQTEVICLNCLWELEKGDQCFCRAVMLAVGQVRKFLCGFLENVVYLFFWYWWKLNKRCCYIWHNSWNVRRDVVEILPYLFDLLREKLTERMSKLSSWNVGLKRTDWIYQAKSLNVYKTKEMCIDFRKNQSCSKPVYIKGEAVDRVET